MKDVLTCKEFYGSVHFDGQDQALHGKIEGIADLVTFEATTVDERVKSFGEAVDDYLDLLQADGQEASEVLQGQLQRAHLAGDAYGPNAALSHER